MEKPRGWEGLPGGENQVGRRQWSETGPRTTHTPARGGCHKGKVTCVEARDTLVVAKVAADV